MSFLSRALLTLALPTLQAEPDRILERLKTEDSAERRAALDELRRHGPAGVEAALRTLGNVRPGIEGRVGEIVRHLAARTWRERNRAMRELVDLGRAARPALEEHQKGAADPEVAWRIRAALAEIADHAGREERLEEARNAALCEFLGDAGDPRAVGPLLKPAGAGALEVRIRAAEALGRLRDRMDAGQADEAAERILDALAGTKPPPTPLQKSRLIRALAHLRAPAAVRPLGALLADRSERNVQVKRSCIAALAAVGDERAVRALVLALAAEDPYVRQGAASSLEALAGETFGVDPAAAPAENRAAIGKVRQWWEKKFGKEWEE